MDEDKARDILLGSGGQTISIGGPIALAIEAVLAWNERLGNLYDAREAEVLELLREQNAERRAAAEVERLQAVTHAQHAELLQLRGIEARARTVATPEPPPGWSNDHSDGDRSLALWILGEG